MSGGLIFFPLIPFPFLLFYFFSVFSSLSSSSLALLPPFFLFFCPPFLLHLFLCIFLPPLYLVFPFISFFPSLPLTSLLFACSIYSLLSIYLPFSLSSSSFFPSPYVSPPPHCSSILLFQLPFFPSTSSFSLSSFSPFLILL